jgi:hypothetical protein
MAHDKLTDNPPTKRHDWLGVLKSWAVCASSIVPIDEQREDWLGVVGVSSARNASNEMRADRVTALARAATNLGVPQ